MTPALIVFFIIGTIAVASSILVIGMRNPVHSALFLLLTFLCVAVLFVMRAAEFVAAVQVLVYAGGIMVLFLFVVMLINVRHLPDERVLSRFWKGGFAVAHCDLADARAQFANDPDALVAGNEWRRRFDGPVAVRGVNVGVTETARFDPDEHLP